MGWVISSMSRLETLKIFPPQLQVNKVHNKRLFILGFQCLDFHFFFSWERFTLEKHKLLSLGARMQIVSMMLYCKALLMDLLRALKYTNISSERDTGQLMTLTQEWILRDTGVNRR